MFNYSQKKRLFYNSVLSCFLIDETMKLYLAFPDKVNNLFLLALMVDLLGKWMVCKVANNMM